MTFFLIWTWNPENFGQKHLPWTLARITYDMEEIDLVFVTTDITYRGHNVVLMGGMSIDFWKKTADVLIFISRWYFVMVAGLKSSDLPTYWLALKTYV